MPSRSSGMSALICPRTVKPRPGSTSERKDVDRACEDVVRPAEDRYRLPRVDNGRLSDTRHLVDVEGAVDAFRELPVAASREAHHELAVRAARRRACEALLLDGERRQEAPFCRRRPRAAHVELDAARQLSVRSRGIRDGHSLIGGPRRDVRRVREDRDVAGVGDDRTSLEKTEMARVLDLVRPPVLLARYRPRLDTRRDRIELERVLGVGPAGRREIRMPGTPQVPRERLSSRGGRVPTISQSSLAQLVVLEEALGEGRDLLPDLAVDSRPRRLVDPGVEQPEVLGLIGVGVVRREVDELELADVVDLVAVAVRRACGLAPSRHAQLAREHRRTFR